MVLYNVYDRNKIQYKQILIFERGIQWKTFVEYDSHEAAVRARIALNGSDFGDDTQLKMNVFASALKKITLSESNNTSGVGIKIKFLRLFYRLYYTQIEKWRKNSF